MTRKAHRLQLCNVFIWLLNRNTLGISAVKDYIIIVFQ